MLKIDERSKKVLIRDDLKRYVDLNVDLGQSRDQNFYKSNDYALLKHVSSVSIPCCVHDGDPRDVLEAMRVAKAHNCAVGAHVAYPDPAHHGYERPEGITNEELAAWLRVQLGAFKELALVHTVDVQHVRPHGALYATFLNDEETALLVAETIKSVSPWLILMAPGGPILDKIQEETGLRTAPEIYLGKRYTGAGLPDISRLHETLPAQAAHDQGRRLIEDSTLTTANGEVLKMKYKSLHLTASMDGVVELAEKLAQQLVQPVPVGLADVVASGW